MKENSKFNLIKKKLVTTSTKPFWTRGSTAPHRLETNTRLSLHVEIYQGKLMDITIFHGESSNNLADLNRCSLSSYDLNRLLSSIPEEDSASLQHWIEGNKKKWNTPQLSK